MKWCASTAYNLPTRLQCRCVNVAVCLLSLPTPWALQSKSMVAGVQHAVTTTLARCHCARSLGAASQDTDGNGEVTFVEFKVWWDENGGAFPPLTTHGRIRQSLAAALRRASGASVLTVDPVRGAQARHRRSRRRQRERSTCRQ